MAVTNLTNEGKVIDTSRDSIIIVNNLEAIRGGRTLDTTGYTKTTISSGHVVIMETATKEFKPMPVTAEDDAYAALPAGHEYVGVVISTVLTNRPMVGIMYSGTVNPVASPYPVAPIQAAMKTALPTLTFKAD